MCTHPGGCFRVSWMGGAEDALQAVALVPVAAAFVEVSDFAGALQSACRVLLSFPLSACSSTHRSYMRSAALKAVGGIFSG